MHGCSRITIRHAHLDNAGTENVGFLQAGQTLLAPSEKRREVLSGAAFRRKPRNYKKEQWNGSALSGGRAL